MISLARHQSVHIKRLPLYVYFKVVGLNLFETKKDELRVKSVNLKETRLRHSRFVPLKQYLTCIMTEDAARTDFAASGKAALLLPLIAKLRVNCNTSGNDNRWIDSGAAEGADSWPYRVNFSRRSLRIFRFSFSALTCSRFCRVTFLFRVM